MTENGNHLARSVFLRPIGVPLPLGLAGLTIASFVDSGLELHWVKPSEGLQVGLILVSVPFILQLIASVLSYLARDGSAGAALGVLATSWLALGLIHIAAPHSRTSGAVGLLLLVAGASIALSAVAVAAAKPLPALVFLAAALRFGLSGVYRLSTVSAWERAAGILGLVVCGLAGYSLLAFELESQQRSTVLPTFRRGPGAAAIEDGSRAQFDQVVHEPGVRRTT